MNDLISLCKRRGFIFQGSEIYGGLAGTWDFGPYGVALKNNIKNSWWKKFVDNRTDMYGVDAAILMNSAVWEASGHVAGFSDPLVECTKCKKRFRADQLKEEGKCDSCGSPTGEARQFNMMFSTKVGAVEDSSATAYLRPETAQGIFVNFKNIVDSIHPKLPFGIAQIGKAFRNEITPRDFIFRQREFEQMEIEYFVRPPRVVSQTGADLTQKNAEPEQEEWERYFSYWKDEMVEWMDGVGIDMSKVHDIEIGDGDRAHYSSRTVDFEFEYPFGQKELFGLAYRTDFDLKNHKLEYVDDDPSTSSGQVGEKIVPHVIEPTFGVDRALLAVMLSAYDDSDPERVFLKFKPSIAPVLCAVSPLLKNKPELVDKAREIFMSLKQEFGRVLWDDNGNIGKRYRRQDEIGTPVCITVDFETLEGKGITVRNRDTGEQTRIAEAEISTFLKSLIG